MSNLKVNVGDPVRASSWNSLVDRVEQSQAGFGALASSINPSSIVVTNNSGRDYEVGEAMAIETYDGPTEPLEVSDGLRVICGLPIWHSNIARIAIAAESIPDQELGIAVVAGICIIKVADESVREYVMIDPATPTQCKFATGGIAKVITEVNATHVIANMGDRSNLWRYELTEANQSPGDTDAKLVSLDGAEFTASIDLSDPLSVGSEEPSEHEGYCIHVGNEFHISVGPCP